MCTDASSPIATAATYSIDYNHAKPIAKHGIDPIPTHIDYPTPADLGAMAGVVNSQAYVTEYVEEVCHNC